MRSCPFGEGGSGQGGLCFGRILEKSQMKETRHQVYRHRSLCRQVFDHFHVVKLMNEKLDEIRRAQYNMEKDIHKRKVLKGTRYLLLRNGADIFDKEYKTRLDNALDMNKPLSQAYYLKE